MTAALLTSQLNACDPHTAYRDHDGDGAGNFHDRMTSDEGFKEVPKGYVSWDASDCDDADPNVHMGQLEKPGDGKDNDCNGTTDEGGKSNPSSPGGPSGPAMVVPAAF